MLLDATKTYPDDLSYMFDGAIAARVVDLLTTFDINAEVEEYEIGMSQVRLDPTDRTQPTGWIAVAGQGNDMTLGWFAMQTSLEDSGSPNMPVTSNYYELLDGAQTVSLGLPISAEPAQIALTLMSFLAKA